MPNRLPSAPNHTVVPHSIFCSSFPGNFLSLSDGHRGFNELLTDLLLTSYRLSPEPKIARFREALLKSIHHDAQSLRRAAIQRYLSAQDRINDRYTRRVVGVLLLVLAMVTILSAILVIRFYAS